MFLCSNFSPARWSSFVGWWSSARERETERKSIPLDGDGFRHWAPPFSFRKIGDFVYLDSRYFSMEKRQIFHKMKYFVPAV
jgi:hypothetical protein